MTSLLQYCHLIIGWSSNQNAPTFYFLYVTAFQTWQGFLEHKCFSWIYSRWLHTTMLPEKKS